MHGLQYASGDYILLMDADMSHHVSNLSTVNTLEMPLPESECKVRRKTSSARELCPYAGHCSMKLSLVLPDPDNES